MEYNFPYISPFREVFKILSQLVLKMMTSLLDLILKAIFKEEKPLIILEISLIMISFKETKLFLERP
jgi:hypothetical protein